MQVENKIISIEINKKANLSSRLSQIDIKGKTVKRYSAGYILPDKIEATITENETVGKIIEISNLSNIDRYVLDIAFGTEMLLYNKVYKDVLNLRILKNNFDNTYITYSINNQIERVTLNQFIHMASMISDIEANDNVDYSIPLFNNITKLNIKLQAYKNSIESATLLLMV